MPLWRNRKQRHVAGQDNYLPAGFHDGTVAQIMITRRQGHQTKRGYQNSGWDLVDVVSGEVIAEYNDETAPPPSSWRRRGPGRVTHQGQMPSPAFPPPNGNELGEMFQAIYTLCYNTTIEAMQLMAQAMPEHQHAEDGDVIACLGIKAFTKLPVTMGTTKQKPSQCAAMKEVLTEVDPF